MIYDFWWQDSELIKHVQSDHLQRTADNRNSIHYASDMSPIVTEHQAIYSGDIIINYYLHDPSVLGPSSNSLSALSLCDLNVGSDADGHTSHDVFSYYPHTASSNSLFAPNVGLRDINLADSSSIAYSESSIQSFHYDTHHHVQFQEEPYREYPVNNHSSESHASCHSFDCKWNDGHGLCGRPTDTDRIPEHMAAYHFKRSESQDGQLKCRWEGCRRSKHYRRDTIIRHIREVHLGIPRPKRLVARAIGQLRWPRRKPRAK